jgi:hypothetical protein
LVSNLLCRATSSEPGAAEHDAEADEQQVRRRQLINSSPFDLLRPTSVNEGTPFFPPHLVLRAVSWSTHFQVCTWKYEMLYVAAGSCLLTCAHNQPHVHRDARIVYRVNLQPDLCRRSCDPCLKMGMWIPWPIYLGPTQKAQAKQPWIKAHRNISKWTSRVFFWCGSSTSARWRGLGPPLSRTLDFYYFYFFYEFTKIYVCSF